MPRCHMAHGSNLLYFYFLITIQLQIIYELIKFDHVLGVVSKTRTSGGNRTHDPHANNIAHYPLD